MFILGRALRQKLSWLSNLDGGKVSLASCPFPSARVRHDAANRLAKATRDVTFRVKDLVEALMAGTPGRTAKAAVARRDLARRNTHAGLAHS